MLCIISIYQYMYIDYAAFELFRKFATKTVHKSGSIFSHKLGFRAILNPI